MLKCIFPQSWFYSIKHTKTLAIVFLASEVLDIVVKNSKHNKKICLVFIYNLLFSQKFKPPYLGLKNAKVGFTLQDDLVSKDAFQTSLEE